MKNRLSFSAHMAIGFALFIIIEAICILYIDKPVSIYLRGVENDVPLFIDYFRAYTDYSKAKWWLVPSGIGTVICMALAAYPKWAAEKRLAWRRHGFRFAFFFGCVVVSGIATNIIKRIVGRTRPILLDKEEIYGMKPFSFDHAHNSWPSGHATTAFAVTFAFTILFPRYRALFVAGAILFAISRVMVNAHFVSDTIAGAFVGVLTSAYVVHFFRRRGWLSPSKV